MTSYRRKGLSLRTAGGFAVATALTFATSAQSAPAPAPAPQLSEVTATSDGKIHGAFKPAGCGSDGWTVEKDGTCTLSNPGAVTVDTKGVVALKKPVYLGPALQPLSTDRLLESDGQEYVIVSVLSEKAGSPGKDVGRSSLSKGNVVVAHLQHSTVLQVLYLTESAAAPTLSSVTVVSDDDVEGTFSPGGCPEVGWGVSAGVCKLQNAAGLGASDGEALHTPVFLDDTLVPSSGSPIIVEGFSSKQSRPLRYEIRGAVRPSDIITGDTLRDGMPSMSSGSFLIGKELSPGVAPTLRLFYLTDAVIVRHMVWSESDCARTVGHELPQDQLVCVDLLSPVTGIVAVPRNNIIAPNRGLTVVVRHAPTERITAELSGAAGISLPTIKSGSGAQSKPVGASTEVYDIFSFPPHTGDSTVLTVKGTSADDKELHNLPFTFLIDKRYWSAIRFGVGTLFGDFHVYDAKPFAGSHSLNMNQITDSLIPVSFELVSGFAFFPEAFHGGRSYTMRGQNCHVAPYVGFGLLGQRADSVSALTSFHAGLDIEFTSDLSLAITGAAHRSPKLDSGYSAGSPVTTLDSVTHEGWFPSFGVVVNATPSFLKLAQ